MKTINDLVKKLNIFFGYGDFYIEKDDEMNSYTLCINYLGSHDGLVEFDKEYKDWIVETQFGLVTAEIQKMIMDFIYTTDSNHWFDEPEKEYNIIVGEDLEPSVHQKWKSAYMKTEYGFSVRLALPERDFIKEEYQFNKCEIEYLKSALPDNMAKIVDLGKVEVKDD